MKHIFMTLIAMTLVMGLFFTFQALIATHAPEMQLMASVFRGFVALILLMGVVIISKSTFEIVQTCIIKK